MTLSRFALATLLSLSACSEDEGSSAGTPTTTLDPTASSGPTTATSSSGPGTSADDSSGTTMPTPADACATVCAVVHACDLASTPDEESCLARCEESLTLTEGTVACNGAVQALVACNAELDCTELENMGCSAERETMVAGCFDDSDPAELASCTATCMKSSACDMTADPHLMWHCLDGCTERYDDARADGEACVSALDTARACVEPLSCEDYNAWRDEIGDPFPCSEEDDGVRSSCPNLPY